VESDKENVLNQMKYLIYIFEKLSNINIKSEQELINSLLH
jgi:hypothetical protein